MLRFDRMSSLKTWTTELCIQYFSYHFYYNNKFNILGLWVKPDMTLGYIILPVIV